MIITLGEIVTNSGPHNGARILQVRGCAWSPRSRGCGYSVRTSLPSFWDKLGSTRSISSLVQFNSPSAVSKSLFITKRSKNSLIMNNVEDYKHGVRSGNTGPCVEKVESSDVIIVGAGVAGSALAFSLGKVIFSLFKHVCFLHFFTYALYMNHKRFIKE